jgi:hypothetical protein
VSIGYCFWHHFSSFAIHRLGIMNGTNNGSSSKGSATKGSATKGPDQSVKTSAARRVEGTVRVEGTNVVRVPFGVRQSRRVRPQRPDHWATLVLPFHAGGQPTPPPQAA